MMDRGLAGHLRPADFDHALDDGGIRLTRTLTAGAITWDLVSRGRDQDRAMGLLADRVLRPVLDPSVLEPQRLACWRDEQEVLASPEARLRDALGLDGPPPATEQSLGLLTFKDLETFLRRVFRPDRALLALEGDLGREQAKALVLLSFGTWTGEPLPPEPASAQTPQASPAPAPARIPAPGAPLRIEAAAPVTADLSPALHDLLLLLLRNDPALAPVRLATPAEPESPLRFTLTADQRADAALATLRDRLDRLRRRGYAQVDLDRAKAAWAGGQQVRSLDPQTLLADDGRAFEGRLALAPEVAATSLAALNGALLRWLDPARLRWAVLGDPKDLPTP